jgi:hypothetical protein
MLTKMGKNALQIICLCRANDSKHKRNFVICAIHIWNMSLKWLIAFNFKNMNCPENRVIQQN